ncbi:hypothetical protein CsatB_006421 [Cannabis sativa]
MMTLAMWMKIPGLIFSLELIFSQLGLVSRISLLLRSSSVLCSGFFKMFRELCIS